MKGYLRYYFLENYLFDEVSRNFQKRGWLKPEEFIAIVIWKRSASKNKVADGIRASSKTVRNITQQIYKARGYEDRLNILLGIKGIGIAIASAILTVLYPKDFTVIDFRALNSLQSLGVKVRGRPTDRIDDYLNYVDICKRGRRRYGLSLRDFDRALWAKDFYEGGNGLKQVVQKIK